LARKLYEQGKTIRVIPCKCYPCKDNTLFGEGFAMNKEDSSVANPYPGEDVSFDRRVLWTEWYNCCYETGYYAAYYIKDEDHPDYRKALIEEGERRQAKANFYDD
jgi:hypothetical protein